MNAKTRTSTEVSAFEKATAIDLGFMAGLVGDEVRQYLRVELPESADEHLMNCAVAAFTNDRSLRRKFSGGQGPDYVRSFMRHWLSAASQMQPVRATSKAAI